MTTYLSKTAKLLANLLENGSVSASSIDNGSKTTQTLYARLNTAGIIKKQRSSGGNHYLLLHSSKLQAFIGSEFPSGLVKPQQDSANRTFGIITRGDSKTVSKLGFDLIMLRGNSEVVINQQSHQLANLDDAFLSLKISDEHKITLTQSNCRIVTIENPTVFTELTKITDLEWDIAVYTAGKMSNLLLDQLQQWHLAGHTLLHFGDYDYVGLLEYTRILGCCASAELHCPTNLNQDFINRYGNSALHQKQIVQHQALLKRLQTLPDSAQMQKLLTIHQLLQSTAKGLEQEAFLIHVKPTNP